MKRLHRLVVTGAFGGLAAGTAVASAAFACTTEAYIAFDDLHAPMNSVEAGDPLDVRVRLFESPAKGQPISILWSGANQNIELARGDGPHFDTTVTVPDNVVDGEYNLVAVQLDVNDSTKTIARRSQRVFVVKQVAAPVSAPKTDAVGPGQTDPVPTDTPQASTPGRPGAAPAGPAAARTLAPSTGAPGVAPSAAPARQAAPSALPADGPVPAPATPTIEPVRPLEPGASDLWSGVSSESTSSLLDGAAVPSEERGSGPAGVVLLGVGLAALAGTALVGRRQLALSRASR